MATNIRRIQPREQDIRTQTNASWTDAFAIWEAGNPTAIRGANVGNGTVTVTAVDPQAPLGGHSLTITSVGTLTGFSITDPSGVVTGGGYVGGSVYAGGFTLTATQGSVPFAPGDAFALQAVPVPIDLTGIAFVLQVRRTQNTPSVAFQATSEASDTSQAPLIVGNGAVALNASDAVMSGSVFPTGSYVYDLLAVADSIKTVAYYGVLTHVAGVAFVP